MRSMVLMFAAACSAALVASSDADAKRLGGGKSVGAPRDAVTQRAATPPPAATPAAAAPASSVAAKAPAAAAAAAPAAAAQTGWRRFMGPIAGIAAGLGIAALMSHLGLGEAFGNFLMIALLVIAAIVVVRLLMRKSAKTDARQGLQYSAAGAGTGSGMGASMGAANPPPPSSGSSFDPYGTGAGRSSGVPSPISGGGSLAGDVGASLPAQPYPPGFDPVPFLQQAKVNFADLQSAFDSGDTSMLRDVMTPEMFAEVSRDLEGRATHQPTEIVTIDAEILEVTTENGSHWATVRFHGLTREDGAETGQPFNEAWNLKKSVDGRTGWLLAGIQQL